MIESEPTVVFTDQIRATGRLVRGLDEIPVVSFILERPRHDSSVDWRFTLYVAEENRGRLQEITRDSGQPLAFVGVANTGRHLSTPTITWTHQEGNHLEGTVQDIRTFLREVGRVPTRQFISVALTPTSLALPEFDPLSIVKTVQGEIRSEPRSTGDEWLPREVSMGGRAFRFSLRYAYEHVGVGGKRSTLMIPTPTLSATLTGLSCRADIREQMEELASELEAPLRVISFLSRRFVHWTSIRLSSFWDDEPRVHDENTWSRAIWLSPQAERREAFVNAFRMPATALEQVLASLRDSPYRDALQSAIVYLTGSRDASHLESKFINALTALEALVSGITEHDGSARSLGSSVFDRLATALRDTIRSFAATNNISQEGADAVIQKIPELRRRALGPRIVQTVERYELVTSDIWPEQALSEGLADVYRRRNQLVHGGRFESPRQAYVDTMRVRALVERLIYRILGGDDNWRPPRADRHLQDLNSIEDS